MPRLATWPVASPKSRRWTLGFAALVLTLLAAPSGALTDVGPPPSLKGVLVPAVPGLLSGRGPIVRNRARAIVLGKALFWDEQVGSDGMACASCHYHAGTDARLKNQVAPGRVSDGRPTAGTFEPMASGGSGGPNYTLRLADFPFYRLADPSDSGSPQLFATDDVVGSGGSFGGTFRGPSSETSPFDDCARSADTTFNVHGLGTRRVTSRNAPSVINAVFSRRNFWDGRASAVFNGVNPFGERDPDAGVWLWRHGRKRFRKLRLLNASLASQAVEPPVDTTEMSCSGRTFADIGRKLLHRRALQFQPVHRADSVLGRYRHRTGNGLGKTYAALVRAAFNRRYWSAPVARTRGAFGSAATGGPPYTQMEANFAMFFGLAMQLYESTLISDQAPFDGPRDAAGVPSELTDQQRRGLTVFINLRCIACHRGPTLSGAVVLENGSAVTEVDRKPIRSASGATMLGLVDTGFVATGVVADGDDPGVGGPDPFGHPLSLTAQYLEILQGHPERVFDLFTVKSCVMTAPFAASTFGEPPFAPAELTSDPAGAEQCTVPQLAAIPTAGTVAEELAKGDQGRLQSGTAGAFKVPSLRNVELTGPYMHNGSMATLEQVVEFYSRGGNFAAAGKDAQFLGVAPVTAQRLADLVAFLKSLTDERVRWERAPFDHPAISVPNGHLGDEQSVQAEGDATGLAETGAFIVRAVGASGRSEALGPLRPLAERLQ